MKTIKRIAALLLVTVMALTVVGCHKKDEIAVTIGDVEFTSAYYMCALINAEMEAQNLVYEKLTDEEKKAEEIDYYSKKVEDKEYVTWVEDRAIENLKKIASYKILCKEAKIELEDSVLTSAKQYTEYYWNNYGYGAYYEPNGVSSATYEKYTIDSYYSEKYFEHLYGKGGDKEIKAEDVKTKIYDNFVIADILNASYAENADDNSKAALKARMENYAKELNSGKKTYEQVYNEYNNITKTDTTTTTTDEKQPKDKYAQVIGSADTNYASEYYDTVKGMKIGEAVVKETSAGDGLYILFKQDIKADDYYLDTLDKDARHLIADKEYEKFIEDYAKKLEADVNKFAVKQFKVKKIVKPEQ